TYSVYRRGGAGPPGASASAGDGVLEGATAAVVLIRLSLWERPAREAWRVRCCGHYSIYGAIRVASIAPAFRNDSRRSGAAYRPRHRHSRSPARKLCCSSPSSLDRDPSRQSSDTSLHSSLLRT